MIKKIAFLTFVFTFMLSCFTMVFANDQIHSSDFTSADVEIEREVHDLPSENKQFSDKFILNIDVQLPEGELVPSVLRFNIFNERDEWLYNQYAPIDSTGKLIFEFPVPKYEIGAKFKLIATTGLTSLNFVGTDYAMGEPFIVETYAYTDEEGNLIISNEAHITVCPLYTTWAEKAEKQVNDIRVWSDTDYLIWVSKSNYAVSVFLRDAGKWDCIKRIDCSIGAPNTPTVTGQYRYYQYQTKWQYDGYYVGPIMRFYRGYAIHSTLMNNDGTDRDARVGKMISHGCVRVSPDDMQWLTYYVPIGTKIYVTEE